MRRVLPGAAVFLLLVSCCFMPAEGRIPQIQGSYAGHSGSAEVTPDSVFRVSSDVHLLAQHVLLIGVADAQRYGKVEVGEFLAVGGTLKVQFTDNRWTPAVGDRFELLSAKRGLWGTFHVLDLPPLPADRRWVIHYDQELPRIDLDGDGAYDVTLEVVKQTKPPAQGQPSIKSTRPLCSPRPWPWRRR
jgi:hypothetical protein